MAAKKPARKGAAKKRAPRSAPVFPDRIFAIASPRSVGGVSMLEAGAAADSTTVGNFVSDPGLVERAGHLLADAGFEVLQATDLMINIAGSRALYESAFGTRLVAEERPTIKQQGIEEPATYIDCADTDVAGLIAVEGTRFEEVLEGVALEEPGYLATATSFPPPVDYWHLDVPADVSLGCNADKVHRSGITGAGIRVAMVDSGWQSHPYFVDRGYRVDPVVLGPGTADPTIDEHGHGTGESANVFATAPDVQLQPVKTATASGALVNLTAAFNAAAALGPHIITNSWGAHVATGPLSAALQARAAAIAAAVASGIVVVFSAGNGNFGFPGQHPDVIAVGGVDIARDGTLRASDYASGFMSQVYPGRRVPDLSGLVGMQPGAQLIMLPVPERCVLDRDLSGGNHPNGDETPDNDGWAAFSGTSAAAPQVAGVCALIKQACARLTPFTIREILMSTARDVTTGVNAQGDPATVGPDLATGDGLVDAHKAVLIAKLRCIVIPTTPIVIPFDAPTIVPKLPVVIPKLPAIPTLPLFPKLPLRPIITPFITPLTPFPPFGPGPDPGPLSEEDVAALERIIIESEEPPQL